MKRNSTAQQIRFVLDQLSPLEDLRSRSMFGGHGIYSGSSFFGIVYDSRLYFKTNTASRQPYESRGMNPFRPHGRQTMNYHEVPAEVIENPAELVRWAQQAILVSNHETF